ncbi:MAG: extracellular solute-binding protein [Treponema sp.]|nr:extracellular solute-binding protein [Treponema sp.]
MKKKIVIVAAIALAVVLIVGGVLLFTPSKNFTVAFYKIDDKQRQGITDVINKIAEDSKFSISYIQYDSEKSLNSQLPLTKKPSVLITTAGHGAESAVSKVSKKVSIPSEITQGMTSSMRSALKSVDNRIIAVPFLSSHLEIDVDLTEFRNSTITQINTWNDVEKFMREQKRKKDSPMIFAGGNPDFLLDFAGAFAESLDGVSSYQAAAKILKQNENSFNAVKVAVALCDEPDSPLATTIKQLKSWYRLGFIHPGVFSLQKNDVEAFASSRLASILSMSLETHRDFAQNTISRYSSVYFPSEHGANSRIFTGKTYYAVQMAKSESAQKLISALLSTEIQETLSRATGVAPVLAQCRTPDKQADDARYWIAATTAPLAGLSNEIYLSKADKSALAAEIAARIRN